MIGFVIVSHSRPLAEAALDLAMQMVHDEPPPVRIASGAQDGFGTDAAAIAEAIDELADAEGVLIMTDLGSAVLSAELALELRESTHPVRISDGPFVEGMTAGIVRALSGGTLDEVATEARGALAAKRRDEPDDASEPAESARAPVPADSPDSPGAGVTAEEPLVNKVGLHSRPAATLVRAVRTFTSDIRISNATSGAGPVKANSMVGLLSLGAGKGDVLRIEADGPDAEQAVAALRELMRDGFGEND
ncbi:dihydroxyacetone kinase phosphotransfer subunit [Microbacterium sp. AK009]|uniref:dihydroxyacetone kinase phosphoryl donor subunit DhaM n=1 Tax=Microbacterium sp. AK009 TaxID=2723068 RepID=UPI0015CAF677|nr:dihydroxyacetone kinase phosphoryl donor subunit DhaM [Microbacterium sp. AK009]NYF18020.1 dihydroxyacetone kinase phosphotransfer subunit [Microbacterium sp. AK009]